MEDQNFHFSILCWIPTRIWQTEIETLTLTLTQEGGEAHRSGRGGRWQREGGGGKQRFARTRTHTRRSGQSRRCPTPRFARSPRRREAIGEDSEEAAFRRGGDRGGWGRRRCRRDRKGTGRERLGLGWEGGRWTPGRGCRRRRTGSRSPFEENEGVLDPVTACQFKL